MTLQVLNPFLTVEEMAGSGPANVAAREENTRGARTIREGNEIVNQSNELKLNEMNRAEKARSNYEILQKQIDDESLKRIQQASQAQQPSQPMAPSPNEPVAAAPTQAASPTTGDFTRYDRALEASQTQVTAPLAAPTPTQAAPLQAAPLPSPEAVKLQTIENLKKVYETPITPDGILNPFSREAFPH